MVATIVTKLANSETAREVLLHAEDQELHWARGVKLNEDLVTIKAYVEKDLWTIVMEVEHGSVIYKSHDPAGYLITITTMPNDKYLQGKDKLSESEIASILAAHSSSVAIDLKDISSLKAAKELLKDDYVLKHIPLANPTQDTAARLVIWHIRAYRKLFTDYQSKYSFLWQETGYSNARTLAGAMREEGLI